MSRTSNIPYFPNPPADYNLRYMSQLVQSFSQFAQQTLVLLPVGNFGIFEASTTQTLSAIDTATPILHPTTVGGIGTRAGTVTSQLFVASVGNYTVSTTLQIRSTSAALKTVYVWLEYAGAAVAGSTRAITLTMNDERVALTLNYLLQMAAESYVELVWAADSTAVQLSPLAASAFAPTGASVATTLVQLPR